MQKKNLFLAKTGEDAKMNQYWFSQPTIEFLTAHIEKIWQPHFRGAFISTPSVYCSIKNKDIKTNCRVFEFDEKFNKEPGFVFYDFNKPKEIPEDLANSFDFILIDPPFITEEVWSKYAETIKYIQKEDAKILCCSIKENDKMLHSLIQVTPQVFKPSIPHLIYQYNFYSNYEHEDLQQINPEVEN